MYCSCCSNIETFVHANTVDSVMYGDPLDLPAARCHTLSVISESERCTSFGSCSDNYNFLHVKEQMSLLVSAGRNTGCEGKTYPPSLCARVLVNAQSVNVFREVLKTIHDKGLLLDNCFHCRTELLY